VGVVVSRSSPSPPGFVYLAVGGGWLVLWRSGLAIMDFGEHVPLLTAIPFHYAGFRLADPRRFHRT